MQNTRLAPRFKLWLVLGTTAGLIVTALLALMLVWGPRPVVETPSAIAPLDDASQARAYLGETMALWPALSPSLVVPLKAPGVRSNGNQMVLALSSGIALALSTGALWAARQQHILEAPKRDAARLTPRRKCPRPPRFNRAGKSDLIPWQNFWHQ